MTDDPAFRTGLTLTASELEGVAPTAEWSRWIDAGNAPDSKDGAGFRITWADDIELLASLQPDELMIGLEWARLWPTQKAPSAQEVEFRRDLLRSVRDRGIATWACLVDGALPGWFADDERGFTDAKSRSLLWPRHVDWVGETFGDLVDGWIPMREPRQWAAWGNLVGAAPPGRQRRRDTMDMVTSLDEAELEAERLLRGSAPVATYVTGRTVFGERDNVKATPHADWLHDHLAGDWLGSLAHGSARDAFDRVVVQLRPPICVDGEGNWSAPELSDHVDALLDPLESVAASAGDRAVIVAGDFAGIPDDGANQSEHLFGLVDGAIERGCAGWWQTSPIDGWHWQSGFSTTPGVFDRDRNRRNGAEGFVSLKT